MKINIEWKVGLNSETLSMRLRNVTGKMLSVQVIIHVEQVPQEIVSFRILLKEDKDLMTQFMI